MRRTHCASCRATSVASEKLLDLEIQSTIGSTRVNAPSASNERAGAPAGCRPGSQAIATAFGIRGPAGTGRGLSHHSLYGVPTQAVKAIVVEVRPSSPLPSEKEWSQLDRLRKLYACKDV